MFHLTQRFTTGRLSAGLSAITLAAALAVSPAIAQQKKAPAPSPEVTVEELMKPGPLPDVALGKDDAPVTIVEYASLTCGHCATFHNTVLPSLKTKYIDTGKVRLILREFPLDNLAAAASMLGRCAGGDKTYPLVSKLFEKQADWAFVQGNPVPSLLKIAEEFGFTKDTFDKCLTDQKMLDGVTGTRDRGSKTFGVRATPSFFINGKRFEGRADQVAAFEQAIDPLLGPAAPAATPAATPAVTPAPAEKK